MEKGYYIVSLKHTQKRDAYITLWGPNNAGYNFSKEMSGIYITPEKGYTDSENAMPITVELGDSLFMPVKYDGQDKNMIPNCKAVWNVLNVKWVKGELKRII